MFQHQSIWLPDGEKHFPEWMSKNGELVEGRGTYQIKKLREALKHCTQFRCAVDVGGHVGLWAMQLVKVFGRVDAFEPMAQFRACFEANLALNGMPRENVSLYPYALGSVPGFVRMAYNPADSGGTHVAHSKSEVKRLDALEAPGGAVALKTLDSFAFADVDFLKIDCEGYELEVLRGAQQTLARCRPCIIVEQKPAKLAANYGTQGKPAVDFLLALGLGYALRREMGGDFILSAG